MLSDVTFLMCYVRNNKLSALILLLLVIVQALINLCGTGEELSISVQDRTRKLIINETGDSMRGTVH